ncbi:MAG: diacylglycerol kinase family protein [Candidatus Dojkabacteria bacterium]|nr:diacylglycerol kinase family protein [Candidatus Dojkabacteria bacterium]
MDKFNKWKLSRSFSDAFRGLKVIFKNETNFRIELVVAVITILFGFLFKISHTDWIAISIVMSLVFISESINSSIEALSDTMSKDFKINIKYAKDVSGGAVLISSIASLITGLVIFIPYVIELVKNILA